MVNKTVFNQKQLNSLAKLSYKFVELLVLGVVIVGFMQEDPPLAKMLLTIAFIPFPLIAVLICESITDDGS